MPFISGVIFSSVMTLIDPSSTLLFSLSGIPISQTCALCYGIFLTLFSHASTVGCSHSGAGQKNETGESMNHYLDFHLISFLFSSMPHTFPLMHLVSSYLNSPQFNFPRVQTSIFLLGGVRKKHLFGC